MANSSLKKRWQKIINSNRNGGPLHAWFGLKRAITLANKTELAVMNGEETWKALGISKFEPFIFLQEVLTKLYPPKKSSKFVIVSSYNEGNDKEPDAFTNTRARAEKASCILSTYNGFKDIEIITFQEYIILSSGDCDELYVDDEYFSY